MKKYKGISRLLLEEPLSYYYAGLLMADGNIEDGRFRITYGISCKDSELIDCLHNFLLPVKGHEVRTQTVGGLYCAKYISFMDNRDVKSFADKFDLKPRKSTNPPDLSVFYGMPDEMFMAFFCGFIDGDGSIRKIGKRDYYNLSVKCHSSWKDVLDYFAERVLKILGSGYKRLGRFHGDYYSIVFSKYGDIAMMKKYFTETIRLKPMMRKWDKIDKDYISRQDKATRTNSVILEMESQGFSDSDIEQATGVSVGAIRTRRYRRKRDND